VDIVVHPPQQTGYFPVNSGASSAASRFCSLSAGLVYRAVLMAILVALTHKYGWEWLRLLTSEAVLRVSASLGMAAERVSFDTIRIHGELFRFVISCTFVDVFMGVIPFVWNLEKSGFKNFLTLIALAVSLFCLNVLRLEVGQQLHACGVPWIVADEVLAGFAYFSTWLYISRCLALSRLIGGVVAPLPARLNRRRLEWDHNR
jgi:hypothetical protein